MPTFSYGGVELDLDWLLSYTRVSSDQQTKKKGGGGIDRQLENFHLFAAEFHVQEYTGLGSLADEGISGSTGKNVKAGALGRLLANITKLPPKTALVVESFSRLNRLPIDESLAVFLEIVCIHGVPLITLQDRRAYTKQSFRSDKSQVFVISAAMQAARDLAENIAYYSRKGWRKRRGSIRNVVPSWITCENERLILDPAKLPTVHRICYMALDMGVNRLAHALNSEAVPPLNDRQRERDTLLWNTGSLTKLLRGRQLLGEQEVASYVEGKRVVVKGQFEAAYPAAIDQAWWDRIQIKMNGRKSGPGNGRNVTRYTNLFGDLAHCQCGERMKVFRRGDQGQYAYFGCSAAHVGGCDNKQFFRIDKIERTILPRIACEVIDDTPPRDPTEGLEKRIAVARSEATRIQVGYERAMLRTGELAEQVMIKLEREHKAKLEEIATLEQELIAIKAATPSSEAQNMMRTVLDQALAGDVPARQIIAEALPSLIISVICRKDGWLRVKSATSPLAWSVRLTAAHLSQPRSWCGSHMT